VAGGGQGPVDLQGGVLAEWRSGEPGLWERGGAAIQQAYIAGAWRACGVGAQRSGDLAGLCCRGLTEQGPSRQRDWGWRSRDLMGQGVGNSVEQRSGRPTLAGA
jgi:hypothetical protein